MLIIFDLDDTLVETTKCLTPRYLKDAHQAMGSIGPLEELMALNETTLTSKGAITAFWQRYSEDLEVLEKGLETMGQSIPEDLELELVPDCLETLSLIKDMASSIALVTRGEPRLQLQKVEKAGIQQSVFSKLIISSGPSKKSDYQKVIRDLGQDPKDVVVCGDRVPLDLTPAKELGLFTVHFQHGRGRSHQEPKKDVDLVIYRLKELIQVLQKL